MMCPACGSEDVVDYHGHLACVCGRMVDGDCCQGAPVRVSECSPPEPPSPIEQNDPAP
jgi:hypothetical protein